METIMEKKRSRVKTVIFRLFLFWTMVSLAAGMVYLVFSVGKEFRKAEFSGLERETNRLDSNIDYIEMILTYKLHRELYLKQLDENGYDVDELKKAVFINDFYKKNLLEKENLPHPEYRKFLTFLVSFLNRFRLLLGQKPLYLYQRHPLEYYLDLGSYLERNKDFFQAITLYDNALKEVPGIKDDPKTAVIFLHRGYCYSVTGNFERARRDYREVINVYGRENRKAGVTAGILLQYINDFDREVKAVLRSNQNVTDQAEKLFQLLAIKKALEVLDSSLPGQIKEPEKAAYYRARCLEESGLYKQALDEYQKLINTHPASLYSKLANRRLIVISSTAAGGEKLLELAEKNNRFLGDKDFLMLRKLAKEGNPGELIDHLALVNPGRDNKVLEKNLLDIIAKREQLKSNSDNRIAALEVHLSRQQAKTEFQQTASRLKKLEELNSRLYSDARLIREEQLLLKKEKERLTRLLQKADTGMASADTSRPGSTEELYIKDERGKILKKSIFKRDEAGRSSRLSYFLYNYDEMDNLVKISRFNTDNKLLSYYLFEYDDFGNRINVGHYDTKGDLKVLDEVSY